LIWTGISQGSTDFLTNREMTMNSENRESAAFFEEIQASDHAWLAMQGENVQMNKDKDETILLCVWSNKQLTREFIDNLKKTDLAPVEWPSANLINLLEQIDQIEAIAINPTGNTNQIVTYNTAEFINRLTDKA